MFSYTNEPLDNCNLKSFPYSTYRYGWLEQFRAVEGVVIANLPSSAEDIVSVKRFDDDGAIFIIYSDATLNRIAIETHHTQFSPLWSMQLLHEEAHEYLRYYFAIDSSQKRLFFVQNNEVKYAELSCSYFYDSCDSMEITGWSDPMQCRWCAMKNGSGYAFSLEHGGTCQHYLVEKLCAPYIEHVSFLCLC
ncbi:unnamed protein product [Gongylonema pulchrum]|uniref:DPPIV_N domain-containing protein n=1 Tax=Gongylonema pulchrum TaxID=637853 RepID=A0A183E5N2_9BILA|nr:unnamed protein product [Gongylonema pulchrum]